MHRKRWGQVNNLRTQVNEASGEKSTHDLPFFLEFGGTFPGYLFSTSVHSDSHGTWKVFSSCLNWMM